VLRQRSPLNDRTQVIGLHDFTAPSSARTKLLATLLAIGPASGAFIFGIHNLFHPSRPSAIAALLSALTAAAGVGLFAFKPRLTDGQIAAIALLGSVGVAWLVLESPGVPWLASYPIISFVSIMLTHLFVKPRVAVPLHVLMIVTNLACMQIANPSLDSFFTRDVVIAVWMSVAGGIVSVVRRHLDRSTSLLFEQANHDAMTKLANRLSFTTEVNRALLLSNDRGRARHPSGAIFLLDLDRFKEVNDTLGHAFGDALLMQVSERLRTFSRTHALMSGSIAARLGGDEFALFTPNLIDETARHELVEAIRSAVTEHLEIDGVNVAVDVSIGSALHPNDGRTLSALLQQADSEMYRAKVTHSGLQTGDAGEANSGRKTRLLRDLDRAIGTSQLALYYQPKVRLSDGIAYGAESLLRWKHPEFGFVPPNEFIPLAEGTGLIGPLTTSVLKMAATQSAAWDAMGMEIAIAVNISARSLMDREFPAHIKAIFDQAGANPSLLILEVTETAVMRDISLAIVILEEIRALGIRLSIDDFGTGYSSLAYLRDLAFDELKIDRSFVFGMETEANKVIVKASVQLAHNLGLSVVAEGVESQIVLDALRELGCDTAQGYHLSRPMPAHDATVWLQLQSKSTAEIAVTIPQLA
jgi:diguanylate cyclase